MREPPFFRLSVCLFVCLSVHLLVHLYVRMSVCISDKTATRYGKTIVFKYGSNLVASYCSSLLEKENDIKPAKRDEVKTRLDAKFSAGFFAEFIAGYSAGLSAEIVQDIMPISLPELCRIYRRFLCRNCAGPNADLSAGLNAGYDPTKGQHRQKPFSLPFKDFPFDCFFLLMNE